ncbi:cysteine dioxygenase family protein [Mastigocoleus testarum]|uniref:Cupin n=1 Tax=Mastigocoleus testarum BC008 TaxID=371196 RepID=A0A0V7ZSD9_9CYAN|nr:cupin [Mastigocoleus testarum]KST67536.1 cupin [Mastigocoleus testarum BC008]KST69828.1 cupin [Mastigocoleus testarum BC008]
MDLLKNIESTTNTDWLVLDNGECQPYETTTDASDSERPYRLYRFLTDLEDILINVTDDTQRLKLICPLVRRLLNSSEWLQYEFEEPNPETGWSVTTLYDEPDFPLTVQTVAWAPGSSSPIHNHAAWGVVAILDGQEKNKFWQVADEDSDGGIVQIGEKLLLPGEIISFTPNAIHSIEVVGDEPTISFNLYGETNYEQRFEFDPTTGKANNF